MDRALEFVVDCWPFVVLVAAAIAKIANRLTPHFSLTGGFVKALLIIVDLADLIKTTPAPRSKNDTE